jgi:hypothetical protein
MLIWAVSSCTDKRVGRNVVKVKKLTILCHFSGPFAARLPIDAVSFLHRNVGWQFVAMEQFVKQIVIYS